MLRKNRVFLNFRILLSPQDMEAPPTRKALLNQRRPMKPHSQKDGDYRFFVELASTVKRSGLLFFSYILPELLGLDWCVVFNTSKMLLISHSWWKSKPHCACTIIFLDFFESFAKKLVCDSPVRSHFL